jgi:hypothetical protein
MNGLYQDVAGEVHYLTVCLLRLATLQISLVGGCVMDGDFPSILPGHCID